MFLISLVVKIVESVPKLDEMILKRLQSGASPA